VIATGRATSAGVVVAGCALAAGLTALAVRVPFERTPVVVAAILLALMAVPVAVAVVRRRFVLFDPPWIVLFLFAITFPIQAIYLVGVTDYGNGLLADRDRWTTLVNVALVLSGVALVAFFAGYGARRLAARASRMIPVPTAAPDRRRLRGAIVALSAAGLAGWVVFFASVGGLGAFVSSLSEHNANSAGRFYLIWIIHLFPIANLIWFTDRLSRHERAGRFAYVAHLAVAILLLLSLGGRAQVLALLEMLIIIRFFLLRDVKVRHAVALVVVAIAFLAVYGTYRESTESQLTRAEQLSLSPETVREQAAADRERYARLTEPRALADQILQYDYSSLDMFVLLLDEVPDRFPWQHGRTFMDVAIRPLPGALIAEKPDSLNTQYNVRLFGAERGGKKASLLGEGYVNAHVPGIVLLAFLLGVFGRALVIFRERHVALPAAVLVYAVLFRFVQSMTGGGFGEIAMATLMYLLPVLGVLLYAGRGPARAAAPRTLAAAR
jgi:hypothetical protein